MTAAEIWGQTIALMLAWPPPAGHEVAMCFRLATTAARMARAWVRT